MAGERSGGGPSPPPSRDEQGIVPCTPADVAEWSVLVRGIEMSSRPSFGWATLLPSIIIQFSGAGPQG